MNKILTIAGSDCSGGAGIQADLKTFTAHKLYGMSVITALTAQNTCGVTAIKIIDNHFINQQFDAIFNDIRPDATKIGMLANKSIIDVVYKNILKYNPKNIVLDPVMISTSGSVLLESDAINDLVNKLFPLSTIITPNIQEAELLTNMKITSRDDMIIAAKKLAKSTSCAILIKGGHLKDSADDLLYFQNGITWLKSKKINTKNTHGTGCTLSSAIACNLANKMSIIDACKNAKDYINGAIKNELKIGSGNGPINHSWNIK